MNIIVGSHVWIEDPAQAWIDGEVCEACFLVRQRVGDTGKCTFNIFLYVIVG